MKIVLKKVKVFREMSEETGRVAILRFIKKVKANLTEGQEIFNTNLKGYL